MADEKPRRRSLFHKLTHGKPNTPSTTSNGPSGPFRTNSADLASTPSDDADLPPPSKDALFAYQLTLPDPRRLGPDAFQHAGVAPSSAISGRIHGALCAASILSSHDSDHKVYTNRITRKLPNQVPWISVHAQRLLVGLLFFWEEELVRWGLIDVQCEAEKAGFEAVRERVRREGGGGGGDGEEGPGSGSGTMAPPGVPTDSPPAFRSQPPTPAMFATDQTQSSSQSQRIAQSSSQPQPQPSPSTTSLALESRLQGLWEQHRLALARLESSRRQLPSKRDEAGNRIGMSPGFSGRPPAYGDVLSTVGVFGSPSREASPRWGIAARGTGGQNGGESGSGEGASSGARGRSGTAGTLGGLGEPALPMPGGEKGGVGR